MQFGSSRVKWLFGTISNLKEVKVFLCKSVSLGFVQTRCVLLGPRGYGDSVYSVGHGSNRSTD